VAAWPPSGGHAGSVEPSSRILEHVRHDAVHANESAIVDAEDRAYVESLALGPARDVVVASLLRYRNPEALAAGDPLPEVTVRGADDLAPIELTALVRDRPLLLVFGSYT